jgi:ABC-type long-subunit fatty acid transport system fused permease/ATPase subunit
MRKPSKIDFLWVGEVVLTSLSTRLYDYVFDLVSNKLKYPIEQFYGAIGLFLIIGAVIIAFFLIFYYAGWLRIRKKEASINIYSKTELNLGEFLKKAKHETLLFFQSSESP